MLGDDLVSISRRCSKDVEHDVLDGVSQLAELIGRSAFLNIDPDKWHELILILLRHNVKLRWTDGVAAQ